MRVCIAVVAVAVLAAAGCGGQGSATAACRLDRGPDVAERTGEHTLVLTVRGCSVRATPRVELFDARGRRLLFAVVPVGGRAGEEQRILLDKYRCDVRATTVARRVRLTVGGRRLDLRLGPEPVLDWCPSEAPSSVVRVYLGAVHPAGTYRSVFRDLEDGRLDRSWPCGPLRAAVAHLPIGGGPSYSPLPALLGRAAARACATALAGIPPGAPRQAVYAAFGKASFPGPRCPAWRWPPASGALDGARVCFARGRATTVQAAVHG